MAQEKTAAVYCRTAHRDDSVIENQKAELTRLANGQGYGRFLVFTDNGASGANLNRPGFDELNTAIDSGAVHTVFVRDISRIGRDWILTEQWLERLHRKGIALMSANEGALLGGDGYGA
jgi:DNA invertase Pin-like site-specific DNA recombinase